jgi:hypothetical protein
MYFCVCGRTEEVHVGYECGTRVGKSEHAKQEHDA